jgi:hypothetical protein
MEDKEEATMGVVVRALAGAGGTSATKWRRIVHIQSPCHDVTVVDTHTGIKWLLTPIGKEENIRWCSYHVPCGDMMPPHKLTNTHDGRHCCTQAVLLSNE